MLNVVQAELILFSPLSSIGICVIGDLQIGCWLGMLVLLGVMSVMFGRVCKG